MKDNQQPKVTKNKDMQMPSNKLHPKVIYVLIFFMFLSTFAGGFQESLELPRWFVLTVHTLSIFSLGVAFASMSRIWVKDVDQEDMKQPIKKS